LVESSVRAAERHTPALTCGNRISRLRESRAAQPRGLVCSPPESGRTAPGVWDECPLCEMAVCEPALCDGQLICLGCAGTCELCASACLPGEYACWECVRLGVGGVR
jgi:hypothetical protein